MRRCSLRAEQPLVRPVERLAVDVLLEQALAHHQPEILARAAPGRVGRLVDDVAQIVEPSRIGRLAGGKPGLARLAALPGPGGEAEDLDLDAAALQRAGEDIGAGRRHRDRTSAHRAGIVEQQRHHGVAEGRVLLLLERQRVQRVHDDARQPRRIEHAFFEIELPGAVLLRHQPALQPVGEPRHHALQVRELLVEIAAQPVELFGLAQVLGRNHLVVLDDEGMIIRTARLVLAVAAGTARLGRSFGIAHLGVFGHLGRQRLGGFGGRFRHVLAGRIGLVHPGLHVLGLGALAVFAVLLLAALLLALLALLLVGFGRAVVAHVEAVEQIVHHVAEIGLMLDEPLQPVELAPGAVLDQRPPEIDELLGGRRRRLAGEAFAHHHGDRLLDRRIGAVGDLVELAAMEAVVDHGGKILRHARHAPRADRFDARLLDRLEHRPRLLSARHQLAVDARIVTRELERDGVGVAAHDRRIGAGELARRLGQAGLAADDAGTFGGERDFKLGLAGDGAQAAGDRALERLGRGFLRGSSCL